LGIIDRNPLEVGYEHDIAGDKYYLKLRFEKGTYIRELAVKEEGKLDKWLNIIPTFRGRGAAYTEKTEPLTFVQPVTDYRSSEDYVRHMYIEGEWEPAPKPKKSYWRIAPDTFDTAKVKIASGPTIEVIEKQEFPEKENKVFALYIGIDEVMRRLGLDLEKHNTLEKIYSELLLAREKGLSKSLIF